jgi:hypothetical protein
MFGAFIDLHLEVFELTRRNDSTSIWHPCGLVDDNDDVTFRCLSDASCLNKFQILDGVIINPAEINCVACRCKASHVRSGYTSISTAINEGSPVVMLLASAMNVEGLVVVTSGGQNHTWSTRCPAVIWGALI